MNIPQNSVRETEERKLVSQSSKMSGKCLIEKSLDYRIGTNTTNFGEKKKLRLSLRRLKAASCLIDKFEQDLHRITKTKTVRVVFKKWKCYATDYFGYEFHLWS